MKIEVLGNVQDAGVPHLGCDCEVCEAARNDCNQRKYSSSLMLKEDNSDNTVRYLIDVTPDIRFQTSGEYIDGAFIPHAHLGHITGLLYFGEEGLDADSMNVYCNSGVEDFLMQNDPFRLLVDRGNIEVESFENEEIDIRGGSIETISFHHPQINHETAGYMITGEEKTLFYLSDITEFTDEVKKNIREADIAIVDGTFCSRDEIDRYEEVPHPPIKESMDEMSDYSTEIYFTHMNHTNPVLREGSEARKTVEENGFGIVEEGQIFTL